MEAAARRGHAQGGVSADGQTESERWGLAEKTLILMTKAAEVTVRNSERSLSAPGSLAARKSALSRWVAGSRLVPPSLPVSENKASRLDGAW